MSKIYGIPVVTPINPGVIDGTGANGKSAYELAVENGFEGTLDEWLDSLVGPPGPADSTVSEALNSHTMDTSNPHGVTAEDVGARPDTWMPTAEEVGARPDTWMPTAEEVGARPGTWMPTAEEIGITSDVFDASEHIADENNPHNVTAEQVGARPNTWTPTAEEVGARPNTWMPTASQVGARPNTWTPTAEEVGAVSQDSLDNYLPRSGGIMEGDVYMNSNCLHFDDGSGSGPYITGYYDSNGVPRLEIMGSDNDEPFQMSYLADPMYDGDAVPKRYVDARTADYIVEQGTSGIWKYRKWNSGRIELWTNSYQFTVSFTTSSNGFSYATESDIPVPLVKSIEFASGDCTKWHYTNWASVTCNDELKLGIRYYGLNSNGNGNTIPFSFYVIGTWK